MEIVLKFNKKELQRVKEILLKDEIVSRASIVFKDGETIGKEGYYCYISGLEEQCKRALELTKDIAEEAEEEEKNKVIEKIK
ncbi:MAG TPA: hypothetical protein ENF38_00990, partial [Candidatus Aenigmarchaeota archaeon]|nr:hypothetical protein [Candidatus Aenigmarchaeota archaeon]